MRARPSRGDVTRARAPRSDAIRQRLPIRLVRPFVDAHAQTRGPSIITSSGDAARALQDHAGQCLGLLRRDLACTPCDRAAARPAGRIVYDPAQGRLDWPPEVVAVVPDTLGAPDLPPHRWQVGSLPAIEASG